MPRVITTVDLADLAELDVWPTLVNFERYPDLMEDVVRVQVLERSETSMVSSWEVLLNGSQFTWTERDTLTAYQASGRGGTVRVRVAGDRVALDGQAVTVWRGELLA